MNTNTTQPVRTENISPRTRFQQSGVRLSAHRDMITSDAFRLAADAALLQYAADIGQQTKDGNAAMASGFRMLGAQELIQVMRQLGDTTPTIRSVINDNLRQQ